LSSGDGWFMLPLVKIARSVVAIDIDPALLDATKVRIAERCGAPNWTFAGADAALANAFHGVPDKPRLRMLYTAFLSPAACSLS